MIKPAAYKNCSAFYEVVKTVEFVKPHGGKDTCFRIDALFDPQSGRYSTTVYYQEDFRLQPAFPVSNGNFTTNPGDFSVWVPFPNAAWTDRDSAEQAIEQALGFLGAH